MSDRFSAASEDSTSALNGRVCELCGSASRTSSASESSQSIGPESPAIPTCAPLWASPKATDADRGGRGDLIQQVRGNWNPHFGKGCPCRCHRSMSSAAVSPAKTSPSPARAQDSTEPARVFGPSTHDSLASFDPDTSSWRTSQLSLLGGLDEFSETWPRSGMTRNGTAYQRVPLAPLTGGIASGLWRTPQARGGDRRGAQNGSERLAQGHSMGLSEQIVSPETWPTPRASDAKGAGDWRKPSTQKMADKSYLGATVVLEAQTPGGQLNPTWVEWLQGFPLGWTEVG